MRLMLLSGTADKALTMLHPAAKPQILYKLTPTKIILTVLSFTVFMVRKKISSFLYGSFVTPLTTMFTNFQPVLSNHVKIC